MSELVLDKGSFFPSPLVARHRERAFKVALAGSLLIHAVLIATIPGFRAIDIEVPTPLTVEIIEEPSVAQSAHEEVDIARTRPKAVPPPAASPPEPAPPQPAVQARPQVAEPSLETIRQLPRPDRVPDAPAIAPQPEPRPAPELTPPPEPRIEARPDMPAPRVAPQQPPAAVPEVLPLPPPPVESLPRAELSEPPRAAAPAPGQQPTQATDARQAPEAERSLVAGYEKSLSELIRRQESYPDRARRQRWEGTAVVGLSLSPEGRVTDIGLLESSGRDILDEAALNMVRRASPLPRAPEGLRGKERVVRVPIVFKLQNS